MEINALFGSMFRETQPKKETTQGVSLDNTFAQAFKQVAISADKVVRGNEIYSAGMGKKVEMDWLENIEENDDTKSILEILLNIKKIDKIIHAKKS